MTGREAASRGICWEGLARIVASAKVSPAAGPIQGRSWSLDAGGNPQLPYIDFHLNVCTLCVAEQRSSHCSHHIPNYNSLFHGNT